MAKSVDPSAINPLIVAGTGPNAIKDTIHLVNNVLAFVAASMEHVEEGGDILPITGSSHGLALVLLTCRAALEYHVEQKGGAE